MAEHSHIEWTDATWQPITGCTLVSEGCANCYAAELAAGRLKHHPSRAGLARRNADGVAKFTGEVRLNEKWLSQPLTWRDPKRVFVCAHSDLFHEKVPDEWIDRVFAVMALCPQHTFQVLTKRPERMREYLSQDRLAQHIWILADQLAVEFNLSESHPSDQFLRDGPEWAKMPLPNVWLGTSAEDQATADERIPELLATPAAIRFVSLEPLLGPVDITPYLYIYTHDDERRIAGGDFDDANPIDYHDPKTTDPADITQPRLDWVIVGGESGKQARPMHPDWARSLRDQCTDAQVAFFFKQWGAWAPQIGAVDGWTLGDNPEQSRFEHLEYDPETGDWGKPFRPAWCDWDGLDEAHVVSRIGKKAAGAMLDGREHREWPPLTSPLGGEVDAPASGEGAF